MSAETLRKLRAKAGLEQTEAADRIGVPVGTYRNWEQGRRAVSPAIAKLIRLVLVK